MNVFTKVLIVIIGLMALVFPKISEASKILTWENNVDATRYEVSMRETGTIDYKIIGTTVLTSYPIPTTLDKTKSYDFIVKAFNDYGNSSDPSDPVSWRALYPKKCVNLKIIDGGGADTAAKTAIK